LAYIEREVLESKAQLSVHLVGEERAAHVLAQPPYDPAGQHLRS
jgi:glycine cleavage system aminomethyltransferase T